MKVEQDSSVHTHPFVEATPRPGAVGGMEGAASQLSKSVVAHLPSGGTRFVAQAPGRLDIMGGFAEYTGSLVLNKTIADQVCVGVSARTDGLLSVLFLPTNGEDGAKDGGGVPVEVSLSALVDATGEPVEAAAARDLCPNDADAGFPAVLGVLVELKRAGAVQDWGTGVSIVIASSLDGYSEVGREAAIVSGMLTAASRALGSPIDTKQAFAVGRKVLHEWLGSPVGSADLLSCLLLAAHAVGQVRSGSFEWVDPLRLPADLVIVGLDCGWALRDAELKFERVRTASLMGRYLIERIVRHEQGDRNGWDGCLSRISMAEYVERFRDRLPTKLVGKDFTDRFGADAVGNAPVSPDFCYKIRSRTEHHIYENARAVQFAQCLSRVIRTGDERGLADAGELMFASHWSYGQRCGLGCAKTDLLVNLLRSEGLGQDICGARVSGCGIGGVVVVLMKSSDLSSCAVERSLQAYQQKFGERPLLLAGSSPGALVTDARPV